MTEKKNKKVTQIAATEPLLKKKKGRRLRVAGYARVSTDSEEQQNSYEAQLDYYKNMIKAKWNWQFVKMYSDDGISGTTAKDRPGFQEMMKDALEGKMDLILTKSISRFARNTVDSLSAIRLLKSHNVEIYFEKENIWTFDSKGELLITIMSSLAQEESRSISENVRWSFRKSFADGKVSFCSEGPYGYRKNAEGKVEIDEGKADVVRFLFHRFFEGWSFQAICRTLNKEGIPGPSGNNEWCVQTMNRILKNEKYRGDAILQKTYTIDFLDKKRKVNNGQMPKWLVENNHPAIISRKASFLIVNMDNKRKENNVVKHRSQLSGYVFCGVCGGMMNEKPIHSGTKHEKRLWFCFDESHPKVKIKQDDVLSCLLENLNKELVKIIPKAKGILADYTVEGDKGVDDGDTVKKVLARMENLSAMLPLEALPLGLSTALMEKVTLKKKAAPVDTDAADSDVSCSSGDISP